MIEYYDMDGNVITLEQWATLFEGDGRRVAQTDLPGGVWVSTVLLGLDHNFGMGGPPIIFETMVFGPDDMTDLDCYRYATKEQALAGHEVVVTRWTGWTPGDPMPDGREASFLTQFLDAMGRATGERIQTPEEAWAFKDDAMVVMYPKDNPLAQEVTDDVRLSAGLADGPVDEEGERRDHGGDPDLSGGSARRGGVEVQQRGPGDGDRDPG